MEPLLYWYPVVYQGEENPNDNVVIQEKGRIIPHQLIKEPYEVDVETMGYSFHLIFGKQIHGWFLCIPNWNIGCELADPSDRNWNLNSLLRTKQMEYEESTAIVWAICSIHELLKLIH